VKKQNSICVAIITDIHANLIALKRALKVIEEQACDEIFVLGDSIGIGPYPKRNFGFAAEDIKMVLGNHEIYYIKGLEPPPDNLSC